MVVDDEKFPRRIQVFLPLLDGVDPISHTDLNEMAEVLEALQKSLGYGTSPAYAGSAVGPKGRNADVAERLSVFLDDTGSLNDVAFVTMETTAGRFAEESTGLFVPFGKTLSGADYRIVYQTFSTEKQDQGSSGSVPHPHAPAWVWIAGKLTTGVILKGRTTDGWKHGVPTAERVIVQLLAFGPASTS